MKNVLLIGSELGKGGAERSISLLSYYLEQLQYNVTLCILSGKGREQYYKTCKNVVFIDPPEHTNALGKIKAWRYRIKKIKELKRVKKIDVSISFLEGPDYVNILTKGKEKVALSIRGSKMYDKVISGTVGKIRKKMLIPYLYQKADEIICVTNALAEEMQQHFGIAPEHLKIIYNFYENEDILNKANEVLTTEEEKIFNQPVIITSGRLHVAKEQDKLIKILARLKQKSTVRLVLLGDGELKQQLISLANELKLTVCDWETDTTYHDADIYFMGFQSNAFKFYKHSKLFALTSSWEGFPNVLAEALICNIPVVSTDCYTGPREILNIQNLDKQQVQHAIKTDVGSLLPMLDNPNEATLQLWADEIRYWLNKDTPNSEAFKTLTQRFTLDAMLQKWQEVIES